MTARPLPAPALGGTARALRHLVGAWRSVTWRELAAFAALGWLFGVVDLSALTEVKAAQQTWALFWRLLMSPVISALVLMLAWLPADRLPMDHPRRLAGLCWACAVGSAAAVGAMWAAIELFHWPTLWELCDPKCKTPMPAGLLFVGDFLSVLLPGGMAVGVLELWRRHRRAETDLQAALHEHDVLARRAMAARLAALQAQVEPQFLFDVLVDIEQQYAGELAPGHAGPGAAGPRGPSEDAAAQLERLINHLRVALPRLRDNNATTLEAEAALLGSYLALWQGLHRQAVPLATDWPVELKGERMPAMLLLPLLQRALRLAAAWPHAVGLKARRQAGRLQVELRVGQPGLCGDDAELAAQRERLQVLVSSGARLHCESLPDATCFTLELPA
ncbi:MAG: histidine kinase [Burkholderiaceae bacterium]